MPESYPGLYRGSVFDINDPEGRGRLRVLVPQVLGSSPSGWAEPTLSTKDQANHDIQDKVWVLFEGGDINRPTYIARMEVRDTDLSPGLTDSLEGYAENTRIIYADKDPSGFFPVGYPLADMVPSNIADTWFRTDENQRQYRWDGTQWYPVPVTNETLETDGTTPSTAPVLRIAGLVGAISVSFDPVPNVDPVEYAVYMSGTTGFTPGPTNVVALGPGTSYVFREEPDGDNLLPGATYFFQARAIDADGNGPLSAEVSGASRLVDYGDLAVGAVRADSLETNLALVGNLRVGQDPLKALRMNPTEGFVAPQPDGDVIQFPVNGDAARFAGHLTARSIHIRDNLTMSGTGTMQSTLTLAAGVGNPQVAPLLSQAWDSTQTTAGTTDSTQVNFGVGVRSKTSNPLNSAQWVLCSNYFGAVVRSYNKTTGALAADLASGKAWTSAFYPDGGMTYSPVAGAWFVLGSDSSRSGNWYVYRLDSSFNKVGETLVGPLSGFPYRPTIGYNAVSGTVVIAWVSYFSTLLVNSYSTSAALPDAVTFLVQANFGAVGWTDTSYIGIETYDLVSGRIMVAGRYGGNVASWVFSSGARDASNDFAEAYGLLLSGMAYDGGKFHSVDEYGRIFHYSTFSLDMPFKVQHSWYDGNGTPHETMPSPIATFTVPRRSYLRVDTPSPPDASNTSGGVDLANQVRLYLATGTNNPKLQTTLTSGTGWSAIYGAQPSTVTADPQVSNGFTSILTSPGELKSPTGIISLKGDESGSIAGVTWNAAAQFTSTKRPMADTGWLSFPFTTGTTVFTNYTGAEYCQYHKYGTRVEVVGLATRSSGTGIIIGTLPVGYRPTRATWRSGMVNGNQVAMVVGTDGTISVGGSFATGDWLGMQIWFDVDERTTP